MLNTEAISKAVGEVAALGFARLHECEPWVEVTEGGFPLPHNRKGAAERGLYLTPEQAAQAVCEKPRECEGVLMPTGERRECFLDAWAEVYCIVADNDVEIMCPRCNGTGSIDEYAELRALVIRLLEEFIAEREAHPGIPVTIDGETKRVEATTPDPRCAVPRQALEALRA